MKLDRIINRAGFSKDSWEDINEDYKANGEFIRCVCKDIDLDIQKQKDNRLLIEIQHFIPQSDEVINGKMNEMDVYYKLINLIASHFPKSRKLTICERENLYESVNISGTKNTTKIYHPPN